MRIFRSQPVGKRVRDFLGDVLLQAKVIRQRPLPGLAHAFVFWGFCAFALVTVNHLATGFGPQVSRSARALRLDGRGVRRVRRGVDRGTVREAFLGPAAMAGRAVSGIGRDRGTDSGADADLSRVVLGGRGCLAAKPLWWAHTLTLAVFLPLIPHTKHLHLVLSPFSVFLSRGRIRANSPAQRRRGLRPRYGQGPDPAGGAASVFLCRVRTLHRTLPGGQYRQGSRSRNKSRWECAGT